MLCIFRKLMQMDYEIGERCCLNKVKISRKFLVVLLNIDICNIFKIFSSGQISILCSGDHVHALSGLVVKDQQ